MILNTLFIEDFEDINLCKKKTDKNDQLEDKNRKPHKYIIWEKVLMTNKK